MSRLVSRFKGAPAALALAVALVAGCDLTVPATTDAPYRGDPFDDLPANGSFGADSGAGTAVADILADARELPDGARAVLPGTAGERAAATFTRLAGPPATPEGDRQVVSGTYQVSMPRPTDRTVPLLITVPVETAHLPAGWEPRGLTTEMKVDGRWRPIAGMGRYDAASQRMAFEVALPGPARPTKPAGYGLAQAGGAWTVEVRLAYLLSARQIVRRDGSRFRIHYYPARVGTAYAIPRDEDWASTSGSATEPTVPDYVEDVDTALNELYDRLMAIESTDGPLFTAPALPIDVTLTDTGGDGGNSGLGGPIELAARQFTGYADLRATAAHELVHVLQRPFYTAIWTPLGLAVPGAQLNRWFIEATANHYAARALGLTDAERRTYYEEFYQQYLNVPITAWDNMSMYTAGDFLDYLSRRVDDRVVADTLLGSAGNDMVALSRVLRARGIAGGIGEAYGDYVQELVTHPERTAGLAGKLKGSMASYASGAMLPEFGGTYQDTTLLTDAVTYATLRKPMPVLSSVFATWDMRNGDDALLVVDTSRCKGSDLRSVAHDFYGAQDAQYTGVKPVDGDAQPPGSKSWTIPHVGRAGKKQVEWAVSNTSITSTATLDAAVYLLRPPLVTNVRDGAVDVDLSPLGNVPRAQIRGLVVQGPSGEIDEPRPLPVTGSVMTIEIPGLRRGQSVAVAFQDVLDNVWPPLDPDAEPTTSLAWLLPMVEEIGLGAGAQADWSGQGPYYLPGAHDRFPRPAVSADGTFSAAFDETGVVDGDDVHETHVTLAGRLTPDASAISQAHYTLRYVETDSVYGPPTYVETVTAQFTIHDLPFSRIDSQDENLPPGTRFEMRFAGSADASKHVTGFQARRVVHFPAQGAGEGYEPPPDVVRTSTHLLWEPEVALRGTTR